MKKLITVLASLILISLVFGLLSGDNMPLSINSAKASFTLQAIPFGVTPTPKPVIGDGGSDGMPEIDEFFPDTPTPKPFEPIVVYFITSTPRPTIPDGSSWDMYERVTNTTPPRQTKPPQQTQPATSRPRTGGGQYLTSEGPLFLSFRQDLTEEFFMFTPMDLTMDAEYHFPLVGSSSQVVGEAKVMVTSGLVIVKYYLTNGVNLDKIDGFFTFFPDIRSVRSVDPLKLQDVKLKFGIPYSVASWLNSDPSVLLYINCPVSYNTGLRGLEDFSFEDPVYVQKVIEYMQLMD